MGTKSIIAAGGGDYTTVQGFVDDADTYWSGASDVYIGEIQDSSAYDEVVIIGGTTTTSATQYLKLTVNAANRHQGVWSTSKARIYRSVFPSSSAIMELAGGSDYCVLEYLQIYSPTTVQYEMGIRNNGDAGNTIISRCVIKGVYSNDSVGIELQSSKGAYTPIYIDHCVVYGWARSAVRYYANSSSTENVYIDYCSFSDNGASGESSSGGVTIRHVSGTANVYIYNTIAVDAIDNTDYYTYAGSPNWNGSNNIASDTSAESRFTSSYDSVVRVTSAPSSGENIWVNNSTVATLDFGIAGSNAYTVEQNGVDRVGSEPDSRQDFSIDIVGTDRADPPTIGAFENPVAAVGIDVDGTVGALTLAGIAADQVRTTNISVDATTGAVSVSGITAEALLSNNLLIEATVGQAVLAGIAADQAATTNIARDASVGTATLTGVAADVGITTAVDVDATAGAATLTGVQADQSITTGLVLNATSGAITDTGIAADYQQTTNIAVDATVGSASISGIAADVDVSTNVGVGATTGAVALAGVTADQVISAGQTFEASIGSAVLSGQAADQQTTTNISVDATAGVATLTGMPAEYVESAPGAYEATPEVVTLTGVPADLVITTELARDADVGAVTLAGVAADQEITSGLARDATPDAVTLTGVAGDVAITTAQYLQAVPGEVVLFGAYADLSIPGVVVSVPEVKRTGGSSKARYARPKQVIIGKKRYVVDNPIQEAHLLKSYIAEQQKQRDMALVAGRTQEVKAKQRRIKLTATKLQRLVEKEPDVHADYLRRIDDEIITMIAGASWI